MAKLIISRNDVESLSRRLEDRSWSRLMNDLPELQRDIRTAARLLTYMYQHGMSVNPLTFENGNEYKPHLSNDNTKED